MSQTTPELPYAFVLIHRKDRDDLAIVADEGTVLEGEIVGHYFAEFAFSTAEIPFDSKIDTEPVFLGVNVLVDPDPDLDPDAGGDSLAFGQEAE